jgi:alpha-1,6-mannosyltransferase
VSPPFWYFTSALPRALHVAYILAPLGAFLDPKVRPVFLVGAGYVALYSNLPHKELRFLFPALPLWNLSAAAALTALWRQRRSFPLARLGFNMAVAGGTALGVATLAVAVAASRCNYPGGVALQRLHQMEAQQARDAASQGRHLSVHVGVFPAMTGVSRFGESPSPWRYCKEEGIAVDDYKFKSFDYVLSDILDIDGFQVLGRVDGFAGVKLTSTSPGVMLLNLLTGELPIKVTTSPQVYIHRGMQRS